MARGQSDRRHVQETKRQCWNVLTDYGERKVHDRHHLIGLVGHFPMSRGVTAKCVRYLMDYYYGSQMGEWTANSVLNEVSRQ